jgi:hypothetical protein
MVFIKNRAINLKLYKIFEKNKIKIKNYFLQSILKLNFNGV